MREAVLEKKSAEAFRMARTILNSVRRDRKASAVIGVVYFPFSDSYLTDEARSTLELIARKVRSHPNLRLELRGFADEFPDNVYSYRLGEQRAERVYDYLARKIIPSTCLSSISYGNQKIQPDASRQEKRLYRRVEIALVEEPHPEKRFAGDDNLLGTLIPDSGQ